MKQVHDQYTKSQRALCAYTGRREVPGFKGGPLVDYAEGSRRETSNLNLARFTYVQTTLLKALSELCVLKETGEGWQVAKVKELIVDQKTVARIFSDNPERMAESQEQLANLLGRFVARLPETVYRIASNANADQFMDAVRTEGRTVVLLAMLDRHIDDMIFEGGHLLIDETIEFTSDGKKKTGGRRNPEFLALLGLKQVLLSITARIKSAKDEYRERGEANGLGRRLFTAREEQIFREVRLQLATLDERTVLRALQAEDSSNMTKIIQRTLAEHWRYGMGARFYFAGQEYLMEASPFAQKAIGTPKARFTLAIYPLNENLRAQLQAISDPAFEHSPGALGSARFTFPSRRTLLLEEIQTDIESLLRIRDVNATEGLLEVLKQWRELIFAGVHIFAAFNGFGEFLAATPLRVLGLYGGPMHPIKSTTYFDFWEKKGGKLVLDEDCEIADDPRYFYRFETDRNGDVREAFNYGPPVKDEKIKMKISCDRLQMPKLYSNTPLSPSAHDPRPNRVC